MRKTSFKTFSIITYLAFASSLLIGFYLDETISGPGAKLDFYHTWNYVIDLQDNIMSNPGIWTVHTPLHYIILSKLNLVFNNQELVRFLTFTSSLLVPYLFYLNLKIKFPETQKKLLFIFSLSLFLYPSFRYSAIWANNHITGLIFFLLSTYFYLKWKEIKPNSLNKYLILCTFSLALAVYTRQYYALIFIYFLYIFFQKLSFFNFFKISLIIFIFSLPGFWLISNFPSLLKTTYSSKFHNTVLINTSILSFYFLPFFFTFWLNLTDKFVIKRKYLLSFIIGLAILIFLILFGFDYLNYRKAGGGFFLKISYLLFNNPYFFYLTSLFGIFCIIMLSTEDKKNLFMLALLVFGFSGSVIYQKYFEPMFVMILFLLINSAVVSGFFINKKNILVYYSYIFLYFISAILNDYIKVTSTIQY